MALTCDIKQLQHSLRFCKGGTVLPGMKSYFYIISKKDIVKWPPRGSLKDYSPSNTRNAATYSVDDFVLAADATWHRVDLVDNSATLTWESQGSAYTRTFKGTFEARFPDPNSDEARVLQALVAHDDIVVLVPSRSGKYYVVGCETFETEATLSGSFGESVESDDQGATFHFEWTDVVPPTYYTGKIVTEDDGIISGASGKTVDNNVTPSE